MFRETLFQAGPPLRSCTEDLQPVRRRGPKEWKDIGWLNDDAEQNRKGHSEAIIFRKPQKIFMPHG